MAAGVLGNSSRTKRRVCLPDGISFATVQRCYHSDFPVVCLDEASKQLVKETREPVAAKHGQAARYDYQYERNGVANLFMLYEPMGSWRHVEVTDRRTAIDYAHLLRDLVDIHYADALLITVVQDNLNTHHPASL